MTTVARPPSPRLRTVGRVLPWVIPYALALGYAAAIVLPVYFVVTAAFKTTNGVLLDPLGLPAEWSFAKFAAAQESTDMLGAVVNSIIVTIGAQLVTIALALPAAYAIARMRGRLGSFIEKLFALGFLVPVFAILVPTFLMAAASGLLYTHAFLILFYPATALPLAVIILAQFIRLIPLEVEEAAEIDGASRLRVMRSIVVPLVRPGLGTVLILNFLVFWNEYVFALILTDNATRTAQVALPLLRDYYRTDFTLVAAGLLITLIPVYIAYVVFHEQMQRAVTMAPGKG